MTTVAVVSLVFFATAAETSNGNWFLPMPPRPPLFLPPLLPLTPLLHPCVIQALELVTTVAVISLVFFTTAAETSIGNWLFTFSSKEMGLEDTDAALANSMFWGAFTLGRVVGVSWVRVGQSGKLERGGMGGERWSRGREDTAAALANSMS